MSESSSPNPSSRDATLVSVAGKTAKARQRIREHGPIFELVEKNWGIWPTDPNRVLLRCIKHNCACERTGRWTGWFNEKTEVVVDYR